MNSKQHVEFFIPGVPVPQGSMRAFNNRVVHVNAGPLKAWRARIKQGYGGDIIDGPVALVLVFTMPRGKTVKREQPTVKPDLDKLIRSVLDGLTGAAFNDDSQVVMIHGRKEYGEIPGVRVWVSET